MSITVENDLNYKSNSDPPFPMKQVALSRVAHSISTWATLIIFYFFFTQTSIMWSLWLHVFLHTIIIFIYDYFPYLEKFVCNCSGSQGVIFVPFCVTVASLRKFWSEVGLLKSKQNWYSPVWIIYKRAFNLYSRNTADW